MLESNFLYNLKSFNKYYITKIIISDYIRIRFKSSCLMKKIILILICKNECLFVCLLVLYALLHHSSDCDETLVSCYVYARKDF